MRRVDDAEWARLIGAEVGESDFPDYVRALQADPTNKALREEAASAFYDQGKAHLESYVAIPFLAELADQSEGGWFFGEVVAYILIYSESVFTPEIPPELLPSIEEALPLVERALLKSLSAELDSEALKIRLGSIAVAKGQYAMGKLFFDGVPCPHCGEGFFFEDLVSAVEDNLE